MAYNIFYIEIMNGGYTGEDIFMCTESYKLS